MDVTEHYAKEEAGFRASRSRVSALGARPRRCRAARTGYALNSASLGNARGNGPTRRVSPCVVCTYVRNTIIVSWNRARETNTRNDFSVDKRFPRFGKFRAVSRHLPERCAKFVTSKRKKKNNNKKTKRERLEKIISSSVQYVYACTG